MPYFLIQECLSLIISNTCPLTWFKGFLCPQAYNVSTFYWKIWYYNERNFDRQMNMNYDVYELWWTFSKMVKKWHNFVVMGSALYLLFSNNGVIYHITMTYHVIDIFWVKSVVEFWNFKIYNRFDEHFKRHIKKHYFSALKPMPGWGLPLFTWPLPSQP